MKQGILCLLQARTNSTRLPGKSLLTIAGLPLAVLAAKRLGNKGHNVILLTSDSNYDDELTLVALDNKVKVFRGSLNNVLERFLSSTDGYHEDTLIVRATADNPIPDGNLINLMEQAFTSENLYYLKCDGCESNAPIGLSLELFRLSSLRNSASKTKNTYDLEHVTPSLKKSGPVTVYKLNIPEIINEKIGIDYLEDYLRVSKIFRKVKDPINISFKDLITPIK